MRLFPAFVSGKVYRETWEAMKRGTSNAEKLRAYSERCDNGCLVWTAGKRNGHGMMRDADGRVREARVVAWEEKHGPVPAGLFVCHKCPNNDRACIEVDHLWLRSAAERLRDGLATGRRPKHYRRQPRYMIEGDL